MTPETASRLQALEAHLEGLSPAERQRNAAPTQDAFIAQIKNGDLLGVACSLEAGRSASEPDKHGLTPLHHAAALGAEGTTALLTREPNPALWQRDQQGRLPLDLAAQAGSKPVFSQLERLTYPERFAELDSAADPQLEAYSALYTEQGRPDTAPPSFPQPPALALDRDSSRDRER